MRVTSFILLSALFLAGLGASFRVVRAGVREPSQFDTSSSVRVEHHPDILPRRGSGRRN